MGVGVTWPRSQRANTELRSLHRSLCSHHTPAQPRSSAGFREGAIVPVSWRAEKEVMEGASGMDPSKEPKGETSLQGLPAASCSNLASSSRGGACRDPPGFPWLVLTSLIELRLCSAGGGVSQALSGPMDLSAFPLATLLLATWAGPLLPNSASFLPTPCS